MPSTKTSVLIGSTVAPMPPPTPDDWSTSSRSSATASPSNQRPERLYPPTPDVGAAAPTRCAPQCPLPSGVYFVSEELAPQRARRLLDHVRQPGGGVGVEHVPLADGGGVHLASAQEALEQLEQVQHALCLVGRQQDDRVGGTHRLTS